MKIGTDFWAEYVAAAKLEVGSTKDYAQRRGISVTALYYWQRKLKAAEIDEASQSSNVVSLRIPNAATCRVRRTGRKRD